MRTPKIGIIGKGFVGSAVLHGFSPAVGCDARTKVYDKDPTKSQNSLSETVNDSDFVFISLPTPSKKDGSMDLTILESSISLISEDLTSKFAYIVSDL